MRGAQSDLLRFLRNLRITEGEFCRNMKLCSQSQYSALNIRMELEKYHFGATEEHTGRCSGT